MIYVELIAKILLVLFKIAKTLLVFFLLAKISL